MIQWPKLCDFMIFFFMIVHTKVIMLYMVATTRLNVLCDVFYSTRQDVVTCNHICPTQLSTSSYNVVTKVTFSNSVSYVMLCHTLGL
jgi:hypothetical protein